ncbi:MAG: response regulator transcription factor [Opitutaceae bacterium]|jgi:two-component system phosphate regulon response regulator PhoB
MPEPSPQKILVVDDEADVANLLAFNLKAKGFTVQTLNHAIQVLSTVRAFMPDLIILDIMMPELNGIQICRMLQADPLLKRIPVIFLTAKTDEQDRIQGLEAGADDYVCKPFSPRELLLRVQSVLRRAAAVPASPSSRHLLLGGIELDAERHEVSVQGKPVELTATEFRLLQLLMERRGRVQSRDHLLTNVWNYEAEIETRTVDTHVRRLREKLGAEADWIETIRGVGYRFAERRPST